MNKSLVEDLGEGQWLIKPTGEIRKCSRSTAYRIAKKAQQAIDNEGEGEPQDFHIQESDPDPPVEPQETTILDEPLHELTIESENFDELTISKPVFDLPSLDDLNKPSSGGGGEGDPSTFPDQENEERDQAFIEGLKNAEIVEDDEGNRKVRIGDLLIGNNPVILSLLRSCDNSLYGWAQNKHGIELWNEDSRNVQRAFFVKMLGMVAPKTSLELDPGIIIIGMVGWLYGVPMIRILKLRKPKIKKSATYTDQQIERVIFDE